MDRLGYDRYGVQGGDMGAFVAPEMGRLADGKVIGVHMNAATFGFIPFGEVSEEEAASFTEFETGGHVAAMEAPALLTGDIRAFFRTVR
jgi:epoxide hydrolase